MPSANHLSRTVEAEVCDAAGQRQFQRALLAWYKAKRRDLPWRSTADPYRIWLSEVMLQQTRVAVVIEYYRRFLRRFPTVEKLAQARDSSVLAAWSGLGYYRRARMLHACAKIVVKKYGGSLPATRDELLQLPGIGSYTSAAIASIAFDEAVAAVDGNVHRIIRRMTGSPVSLEQARKTTEQLVSDRHPGDFNQAMMELGATICTPVKPKCPACPVARFCSARGEVPVKADRGLRRKVTIRYALASRQQKICLVQRPAGARVMPGMWELPTTTARPECPLVMLRHSITSTDYRVFAYRHSGPRPAKGSWFGRRQLVRLPLTGLTQKILRAIKII